MKLKPVALGLTVLGLSACGGGGGDASGTGGTTTAPTVTASSVVSGTAATGSALANANVSITDSAGNAACKESAITTTALGTYTCTLKAGETAPFFVVVTDPTGNSEPLVSVATTTPAPGASLTVNATPLTTAIVAQLSPDGNALTLANSRTVDAAALQSVITNVLAQLGSVLAAIGAPADYNPFTTAITAATAAGAGNTADQVLDIVKVVTNPATGKLALTTVDSTTLVDLATATSSGTPVSAPAAGVAALPQAAQIMAKALGDCFAATTAQRVQGTDTSTPASQGGPEVTAASAACQVITADSGNAAGVNFLHNGYSAAQLFYPLLTSDTMTGAQFSVPEIMAFYPASATVSGADEAVMNIRYLDANGNPGNLILNARNIANTTSAARPTNWWLVGNQHPADVGIKLQIRRVEQLNPSYAGTGNGMATFQTGLQVNANAKGPGSIDATYGAVTYARISGPGLPGNGAPGTGLVYVAPVQAGQNTMDLLNKTGDVTGTGARCGNPNGTTYNCPNLWIARTAGISGSAATTLAANQSTPVWAQPTDGVDPKLIVKGARYKVELFYGSDTTHPVVFHKTLLTDLIQAEQAVNLPWNTPGAKTLAALDVNGSLTGAQTNLTFDWTQNLSAQQIGGAQAVVDSSGSFGPMVSVPRGATSVVLSAVPAFAVTSPASRTVLFSYRMLDNSSKSAVYRYN